MATRGGRCRSQKHQPAHCWPGANHARMERASPSTERFVVPARGKGNEGCALVVFSHQLSNVSSAARAGVEPRSFFLPLVRQFHCVEF